MEITTLLIVVAVVAFVRPDLEIQKICKQKIREV